MTVECLDTLKKENESLKNQAIQNSQGVNSLLASLDAHKQHLNDVNNLVLNLRTNNILLTKSNKELTEQFAKMQQAFATTQKELENVKNKLSTYENTPAADAA